MVSIKKIITITSLSSLLIITACAPQPPRQDKDEDIYAALRDDNAIQYADGSVEEGDQQDTGINEASPAFVDQQLKDIRLNFFKRRYAEAGDLAENLIRLDSQNAEAYYWLSRIRLDQSDFYQAHEMSSKGLSVVDPNDKALIRELERIQGISQMGN